MISIVQQVQSVSAQSGSAQSDSVQSKRGRGDFENHVEEQRKHRTDDVSAKPVDRQSDTANEPSGVQDTKSAETENKATETSSDGQDATEDQTSDEQQAQPDESDSAALDTDVQVEDTEFDATFLAEGVQDPVAAADATAPTQIPPENGLSKSDTTEVVVPAEVMTVPSHDAESGSTAGQTPEPGADEFVEIGSEDATAHDPMVGLAASQPTPGQQAPIATLAQPAQNATRRPAQAAELVQPTIEADTTVEETAQPKLADELRLKAGTESLRAELAASQVASRTTTAAPAIPMPAWGSQPSAQPTRPATPSASGLMTAGGALMAPNAIGAALTAAVSDKAAVGLSAQLAGASLSAERDSDMIALPQMLTEASVRAGSSTAHRDGTPRLVAVQLAEAAMQGKPKVDVVLNPQELGNVTMRLSTTENGIAMVIQAERPETEELMRRHIHELEKEFKEMGFDNIEFSFAGSGAEHSDGSEGGSGEAGDALLDGDALMETEQEAALIGGHLNLAAEVLDMRV